MKKIYVYQPSDIVIYFRDNEIQMIVDVGDAEMIEDGITLAGGTLVYIDSQPEINGGICFATTVIDDHLEKVIGDRINKYIKDNNL